ncbi:MAG: alpha/beta fold hydrolase [Solirubrobacteraceae bacterium]
MLSTIVLLHGFTQTSASWRGLIEAGIGERYTALAPDLRGHGTRTEARPVSFGACLEDIAALSSEPFALCGYSMGGRLALLFALAHPDRVSRLVLLGASPGIADPAERDARRAADEELAESIERDGVELFGRRWARQPLLRGQPRAVAAAAHEDRMRNSAAGLAAALRGLSTGRMEPLWGRLAELTMPVTVVSGERDGKFVAIGRRMGQLIPRAQVVELPAVGHAVALEAPALVAALL